MCGHKKLICCHLLLKRYPKILSLFQIGICLASVDWLKPVFSYSLLSWDKTFKNIVSLYILIFFHWHSYGTCLLKCKVNDSRRGLCLVIFEVLADYEDITTSSESSDSRSALELYHRRRRRRRARQEKKAEVVLPFAPRTKVEIGPRYRRVRVQIPADPESGPSARPLTPEWRNNDFPSLETSTRRVTFARTESPDWWNGNRGSFKISESEKFSFQRPLYKQTNIL